MKVYILTIEERHEGTVEVIACFKSEEKAKEFAEKRPLPDYQELNWYAIEKIDFYD